MHLQFFFHELVIWRLSEDSIAILFIIEPKHVAPILLELLHEIFSVHDTIVNLLSRSVAGWHVGTFLQIEGSFLYAYDALQKANFA